MFDSPDATPASPAPPSAPLQAANQDIHLLDRLGLVYKHRRLVLTGFLLVVIVMMLHSYSTIPLYRAQARLLIEDERSTAGGGVNMNDVLLRYYSDPELYYQTQYRILRSRGLAARVVKRLDLEQVPELNGQEPRQLRLFAAIHSARTAVFSTLRSLVSIFTKPAAVEPPGGDETRAEQQTVPSGESAKEIAYSYALAGRVRVLPVEGTRLVDVTFQAADAQFAALAVNTLAEEYVEHNLDLKRQTTNNTLTWLVEELGKQQQKVEGSERALAEYREAQNALSLEDRQNIVVGALTQLNDAFTRAKTTRVQKEALYNQVRTLDPNSEAAATFVAQNPAVQNVRARLADLQAEEARLSRRYGEKHPAIIKLNASIENAARQLRTERAKAIESLGNDYRAALAEEQKLGAELEQQKRAAMDLSGKSVGYTVLQREAESNRKVYEALLQREKELRVISNSEVNNVQLMDRAEVPKTPFIPNRRRDWFQAALMGLLLGLGLAFGVEYLDDTIKTPDDIARKLKLPLLGLIPAVPGERVPVLSEATPHDFGEAFRALRTSLIFTGGSATSRIIAVTSTQPLEGKTTTACNLGIALALGGASVLLIDADMRRPSLHKSMGMPNTLGLSEVLVRQARIRDAIQRTHDPKLFVVSAGQLPPNPSELLSSDRMKDFLASLATGPFDWVILDTPPVLAVTDATVLTPWVSGFTFVIAAEATRSGHAARAVETLRTASQARIIGAVLNRVDFDRNKYYYSRYYGYHSQYKDYYRPEPTAA